MIRGGHTVRRPFSSDLRQAPYTLKFVGKGEIGDGDCSEANRQD